MPLGRAGRELEGGGAQALWPPLVEELIEKDCINGVQIVPLSKQLTLDAAAVSPLHPGTPKKITDVLRKCSQPLFGRMGSGGDDVRASWSCCAKDGAPSSLHRGPDLSGCSHAVTPRAGGLGPTEPNSVVGGEEAWFVNSWSCGFTDLLLPSLSPSYSS